MRNSLTDRQLQSLNKNYSIVEIYYCLSLFAVIRSIGKLARRVIYYLRSPQVTLENVDKPPGISIFAKIATEHVLGHEIFVYTIWRTLKRGP